MKNKKVNRKSHKLIVLDFLIYNIKNNGTFILKYLEGQEQK